MDIREEAFTEEGKRIYEKTFRKLKPYGTWIFYAADGKTPHIREVYEKEKLHGVRTTYYPSGRKELEETYQFNLITGPVIHYYENGKMQRQSLYRAGRQHGPYVSYHPNGKIKEQGEYVANKKHKEWKEFDEEGKLVKSYMFNAGILQKPKE
jgi:antitoxin component YwqK of YwqJK toxin-antitoxin module